MIVKEGLQIVKLFIGISAGLYVIGRYFSSSFIIYIALICFILAIFSMFFFRNPKREIKVQDNEICSPADGKILEIVEEDHPYFDGKAKVVRIFLSIFNVHVQRAPIQGRIDYIKYTKGKFLPAMAKKAHIENERNEIAIINDDKKRKIVFMQIAGLIARRIVMWKNKDEILNVGELVGMIKFGSQVDLYMPLDTEICVKKGQKVKAGITIMGKFPSEI